MTRKNSLKMPSYEAYDEEDSYVLPTEKVNKEALHRIKYRKIGSASIFGL